MVHLQVFSKPTANSLQSSADVEEWDKKYQLFIKKKKTKLGFLSDFTSANTNRLAPKCLIMQSGLITADSQIPHSRQQTHRNVRQIGCTSQTHKITTYTHHSSNLPRSYLTPPTPHGVLVCLLAVKLARRLAAKYRKFPYNHTTRRDLFPKSKKKKQKHETDYRLSLHVSVNTD